MNKNFNIFKKFKDTGRMFFESGLISYTAGNLSYRDADTVYITASGSSLGYLERKDIIKIDIHTGIKVYGSLPTAVPSLETKVHLNIYKETSFKAIAHAHPPMAIAISFDKDELKLTDEEGKFYMPSVPVVKTSQSSISSDEVAKTIPSILSKTNIAIVEGHGVFAAGQTLRKCAALISTLEHSSKIIYARSLYRK